LAQLEEWPECDLLCSDLEYRKLPVRTTAFLRGFIDRKRGQIPSAIKQFELARTAGRNDVAVLRELAWCHFISGDSDKAEVMLNEAFELQTDNPYLIDMAVQVALQQGKFDVAQKQLERLRFFETDSFYWHRAATLHSRIVDMASAVEAALRSVKGASRPRYEALAHLAYCEIRSGKLEEAQQHLGELDRFFPRLRKGITFALHCHLELKRGNAEEVLRGVDRQVARGNRFLLSIRHGAIRRLLSNPGISEARRAEFEKEIETAGSGSVEDPRFEDLPRIVSS
jgi:tetratricopeptide (TPR) repeat protein